MQGVLISTSFAISRRTANTIYRRSNGNIIGIENVSHALPQAIYPSDLLHVLDIIYNDPPITTNSSPDPLLSTTAGLVFTTWGALSELVIAPGDSKGALTYLRTILVVPLQWFQDNDESSSLGALSSLGLSARPNLPSNLYVNVIFAKSNSRILIPRWAVICYMSLGVGVFMWCIVWLIWGMRTQGSPITSFPLIDFASRVSTGGMINLSLTDTFKQISAGSRFRKSLQNITLFLGKIRDGNHQVQEDAVGANIEGDSEKDWRIGFSTARGGLERLNRG